ncbi:MAG: F0F1 ATP synthase subunit delta [Proteobacteria bacterium]|nr:F0F1 ATP synthase subunit delta [Pseudomonadota bacterium]
MAGQTGHQDIARRYALALFELAKEQSRLELVSLDLQSLKDMIAESEDFRKFIHNASLRRSEEAQVIAALGEKAQFSNVMQKFLGTLAMKRRLDILPEIVAAAQAGIARHKGEVTAQVISAQALDAAQVAHIAVALKKVLGMTVKVELQQDADIMGGLVIQIGSQRIDSSVRAKLERLHRALKNPNVSSDKTKMKEVA